MAGHAFEARCPLSDGTHLFYRGWLPAGVPRGGLLLLHRGHEHSGRLVPLVEALDLPGVALFAWDARGHGRSPGPRGYAPDFATLVRDLDELVRHLGREHGLPAGDLVVLGQSIGAVVAATWVHDCAPRIRALVLVTPALRVRLYVPLAIPALRLLLTLRRGRPTFVRSYVRGRFLTHDADEARRYDRDPLVSRAVAVNVLVGLRDAATRLVEDAGAIRTPTLVLAAGADAVVSRAEQERLVRRLGSPVKALHVFPGLYHDLLHERGRAEPIGRIREFVEATLGRGDGLPPLLHADQHGPTHEEHVQLVRPLPLLSPRGLAFLAQRALLGSLGRLSDGIRLGLREGFDSGASLDYVYRDRARGRLGIGRWLDRWYLDSPGWRGVRRRRAILAGFLAETIARVDPGRRPVRVLDVAAGPGRYLMEAVAAQPVPVSLTLRDRDPANVAAARELARALSLSGVTVEEADAFDPVVAPGPAADVAVVSGLYELVPDNAPVLRSLHALAKALGSGGYLLYTGQPWHPQLELIARVLRNRDGRPWVMRRRTQEELDDLVRAAGFEKLETRVEPAGLFTVSLARIGPVP